MTVEFHKYDNLPERRAGESESKWLLATAARSSGLPRLCISAAGIAPGEAGAASGLTDMLRNLGGALGTAMLATILTKREQLNSNIIGQSVTLYREEVRTRIAELTSGAMSASRLRVHRSRTQQIIPRFP